MTHYSHPRRQSAAWPTVQMLAAQVNQQVNRDSLRVGDAEREEAARILGEHYASGRLDRDEYDERLETVFAARTGSDISAVFRDLPGPPPGAQRPAGPQVLRQRPRSRRSRVPFMPVLLILVGIAAFTGAWWLLWVGLGAFFLLRGGACGAHR